MSDRSFYKNFFSVYIVLVLQNVITLSVNLADNIMLGRYSETALSGVAAVNQIQFIYQQLIAALGEGMVILCSQYWGGKQTRPMKKIAAIAMQSAIILSVILFTLVSVAPRHVLNIFTSDTAVIGQGVQYLSIVRLTYFFFAVTQIMLAFLRSTGTVNIAFILSVMTFFVNCGINYILIYGNFGAPELGVTGAAVGTLIARVTECTVLCIYVIKKRKNYIHSSPIVCKQAEGLQWIDYFRLTAPIFLTGALWGVSNALHTVILGHMDSTAIAANSVASTLFLMVKSAAVGAASAATVFIGHAIGSGDMSLTKKYAKRMQLIFTLIGIFSGLVLFSLRLPVLSLYNLMPSTKAMANTFLLILSIVIVGMSYQMPVNNGIIRGGGSVTFTVKMDFISIWCIVLPLSFIMAFIVKAPPAVVVCCLNSDQIFKCAPAFIKVNYGNWVQKLAK